MTAEVGVLNPIGVALAADSAVTIGRSADKIYSSADKLFHLALNAPVGIMVNGGANFLGIPWETIIKSYRQSLGTKTFPKLEDYAHDFFEFMESNKSLFPRELQDNYFLYQADGFLSHILESCRTAIDRAAEKGDGISDNEYPGIIESVVKRRLKIVRGFERAEGISAKDTAALRKRLSRRVTETRKAIFGELQLTTATTRALSSIVFEMASRAYFGSGRSGIVIAGFGDNDFAPRLVSYEAEIMVQGKVRRSMANSYEISDTNPAVIVPFAQQDMVHSFLTGIDPSLRQLIIKSTNGLFHGLVDNLIEIVTEADSQTGKVLGKNLEKEVPKMLKELFSNWEQASQKLWQPVISIATSLPKDELAAMAEALVNLTKVRNRISIEPETVGGPIDVAIITKGDGFVWVNRKHYFEPALNPRKIGKFTREVCE